MADPTPAYSASSYFNDLHKLTATEQDQLDNWLENLKQTRNKPDEHAECLNTIACCLRAKDPATMAKFFKHSPDLLNMVRNKYGAAWRSADMDRLSRQYTDLEMMRTQRAITQPNQLLLWVAIFYASKYMTLRESGAIHIANEAADHARDNYGFDVRLWGDRNPPPQPAEAAYAAAPAAPAA